MARQVNLYFDQGQTFKYDILVNDADGEPYDPNNVTASGQIRKSYISANAVELAVTVNTGIITLELTAAQTAGMTPGRYIYDIKLVDAANVVTKPIGGIATVGVGSTR